ncbi:terminase large subunit [Apilactobacillus micheneri]|uniref:terminase large subunit n=1 Tax=Apilactobacillus micheneri TaxID=1899430 RepID=UPI001126D5A2|nr:terminase TerL endonuclease subunit [Apilactobacillus micheneri]TPR49846.1 terminase large subunit [Apilactobacillus micheneri]
MSDYVLEYARSVAQDDRLACQKINEACERELKDRKQAKDKDYPYYFDNSLANKYIGLTQLMTDNKLADFQKWIIGSLSGWRFKKDKKMRRFNNAIISMARKNSKSFLSAAILLSDFILNTYDNKQVLIVANSLSQAMLTLDQVKASTRKLLMKSQYLRDNIKINAREIVNKSNGSFIRALPSDPKHLDSLGGTTNLDEAHIYKNSELKDVISSGMAQLKDGLLLQTSTVGFNYNGSFRRDYLIAQKVLSGKVQDERSFYAIYELDDKKEVDNPELWIKANPLFEVEDMREVMQSNLQTQVDNALISDSLNSVLTKNFNVWSKTSNDSFIDIKKWKDNEISKPNFNNRKNVVIGLDLAKKNDLASVSITFEIENDNYYTYQYSFLSDGDNINQKMKSDNINYLAMEQANEVYICKNNYGLIDYNAIYDYVINLVKKYNWENVTIAYDPWGSDFLILPFSKSEYNFNLIEIKQNKLSETIQFLNRLIQSKKLKHSNSKIYEYAFNNLVVSYNSTGMIYLSKANQGNKIDPVFALIDTLKVMQERKINEDTRISELLDSDDFSF